MQTLRTDGKTYGFPQSSRYAPTPRLIFLGLVSFLKASVTPKMGSGGPIWTQFHHDVLRQKKKTLVNKLIAVTNTY